MLDGLGYIRPYNDTTFVLLYGTQGTLFIGDDTNTRLAVAGSGPVTAFFGDGFNVARGGRGDDNFVGGDGSNIFSGGAGNDMLIGGTGSDILSGGQGFDVIVCGENDVVSGGEDMDMFVFLPNFVDDIFAGWYVLPDKEDAALLETLESDEEDVAAPETPVEYVNFSDFNGDEDILDLSQAGIVRSGLTLEDDALIYTSDAGKLRFEGVGTEVMLLGGIDAAIENGTLMVADLFYF